MLPLFPAETLCGPGPSAIVASQPGDAGPVWNQHQFEDRKWISGSAASIYTYTEPIQFLFEYVESLDASAGASPPLSGSDCRYQRQGQGSEACLKLTRIPSEEEEEEKPWRSGVRTVIGKVVCDWLLSEPWFKLG